MDKFNSLPGPYRPGSSPSPWCPLTVSNKDLNQGNQTKMVILRNIDNENINKKIRLNFLSAAAYPPCHPLLHSQKWPGGEHTGMKKKKKK